MLRLSETNTFSLPVKLRLPTENPNSFNEGTISARVKIKSKDELKEMSERELTDMEYIEELLEGVEGLGNSKGEPITGDAAIAEVKTGKWSSYLQAGILGAYFDQFGEARVKNSKPSRGR